MIVYTNENTVYRAKNKKVRLLSKIRDKTVELNLSLPPEETSVDNPIYVDNSRFCIFTRKSHCFLVFIALSLVSIS